MLFLWYSEGTKRNYRHFKSIFKKISLLCGYNFIMEIASLPLHCHFILFWIVLILVSGKRCYVPAKSSYFWQLIYPNNTHEHQNTDFFCSNMYICTTVTWSLHLRYNVTSNRKQITTAKKSTST